MRALLTVAGIVLAVAACGAFGTGDEDTSKASDAGTSAEASSTVDGGGIIVPVDSGSPRAPFCMDTSHVFCESFDTGQPPYTFTPGTSAWPFSPSAVAAFSAPNAVQVSSDAGDTTLKSVSWIDTGTAPNGFTVRFQLQVSTVPDPESDSADAFVLRVDCSGSNDVLLKLKVTEKSRMKLEGTKTSPELDFTTNHWGQVVVTWDGKAGASLGGDFLPAAGTAEAATECASPVTYSFGFSTWAKAPAGAYAMSFDDVEIDKR